MRALRAEILELYAILAPRAYAIFLGLGLGLSRKSRKHDASLLLMGSEPTKYNITSGGISHSVSCLCDRPRCTAYVPTAEL